ncbi:MAG: hypothetical protein IT308_10415 [Anaerolineaceae bacterium]|nr:hypothetical protein [Anaerolineaceae bacterium]
MPECYSVLGHTGDKGIGVCTTAPVPSTIFSAACNTAGKDLYAILQKDGGMKPVPYSAGFITLHINPANYWVKGRKSID